jgi:hypothetical protein
MVCPLDNPRGRHSGYLRRMTDLWASAQPAFADLREQFARDPEASWQSLRAALATRLEDLDSETRDDLLLWLDNLPAEERTALLGSAALDAAAYERLSRPTGEEGHDEAAWQEFLATNGTRWDGTEASWQVFREWFAYEAAQNSLDAPAKELLTHFDSLATAERLTAFAQYGVTIGSAGSTGFAWVGPAERDALRAAWGDDWATPLAADLAARWGAGWESHPAEHRAAWLADLVAHGELPAKATESPGIVEELAAAVPGVEQLSEAEIAAIVAEVLQEEVSER